MYINVRISHTLSLFFSPLDMGFTDWTPMSTFHRTFDVNVFGLIAMTKALLPYLKRTKYSRIINVGSMAGMVAGPGFGAYAARCVPYSC
jgi:NAD(P)-dependent dehydrogenase (short-subunit alcohol dehydrogenase family)